MKKIVVFGATGNIGIYLIDYFVNYFGGRYEIIAVGTRKTSHFNQIGVKYYQVDITNKKSFIVLPTDNVYAVVHLAGLIPASMAKYNPRDYLDVNFMGSFNILEYCRNISSDRILYSQSYADLAGYMENAGTILEPYMERKLKYTGDHAVYSIAKSASMDLIEHYHQQYGLRKFVFRLPNIYLYSPNEYYYIDEKLTIIPYRYMIERAINGENLELWGDPMRAKDIVYVKDLCQMFAKAIDAETVESGIYNVGTGVKTTMRQQLEGIVEVFSPKDHPSKIIELPDKPNCIDYVMNISNARSELGYIPQYNYIQYLEDYKRERNSNRFAGIFAENRR